MSRMRDVSGLIEAFSPEQGWRFDYHSKLLAAPGLTVVYRWTDYVGEPPVVYRWTDYLGDPSAELMGAGPAIALEAYFACCSTKCVKGQPVETYTHQGAWEALLQHHRQGTRHICGVVWNVRPPAALINSAYLPSFQGLTWVSAIAAQAVELEQEVGRGTVFAIREAARQVRRGRVQFARKHLSLALAYYARLHPTEVPARILPLDELGLSDLRKFSRQWRKTPTYGGTPERMFALLVREKTGELVELFPHDASVCRGGSTADLCKACHVTQAEQMEGLRVEPWVNESDVPPWGQPVPWLG